MTQQELKEKYFPLYMGVRIKGSVSDRVIQDTLDTINIDYYLISGDYKLILTPLSEITDEDAIEVGKIMGWITNNPGDTLLLKRGEYIINKIIENTFQGLFTNIVKLINFLRSKGYDCDNLIEQGIAIAKTK